MGIDTRIYLNAHAQPKKILEVVQKTMGLEFIPSTFDKAKKTDFSEPSSKSNSWHLKAVKNDDCITHKDMDYLSLEFKDLLGQQYQTLIFPYLEDDDHSFNNETMLNPRATSLWLAIGKRLVDFFGGKLLYADCSDLEDEKNWYVNNKAMFRAKNKNDKGDDRWYQYYNALSKIDLITTKEIKEMSQKASYDDDERTNNLISFISKYEEAKKLNAQLAKKDKKTKQTKKI